MRSILAVTLVAAFSTVAVAGPKEMAITQLKDAKWAPLDPKDTEGKGPQLAVVFGDPKAKGKPLLFMLKMPAGFKPGPHTHSSDDYATVLQGTVHNFKAPGTDTGPGVTVGGTWVQPANQPHDNECEAASKDGCVILVYVPNGFDFKPYVEKKK